MTTLLSLARQRRDARNRYQTAAMAYADYSGTLSWEHELLAATGGLAAPQEQPCEVELRKAREAYDTADHTYRAAAAAVIRRHNHIAWDGP